jgi:N-acyl amino acid synthase of PEP-CTERM/exosortase system
MDDVRARFRFVQATSPELKQAIYRLRYQIYVEEYGFEQPQDHPYGLEMDAYDSHAICLAALDEAGDVIGTVRLILHSPQGFPIEHAVPTLHFPGDKPAPQCMGEISRLAVSAAYRRRIEDGLYGVESYLRPSAGAGLAGCGVRRVPYERRKRPVIVLGLYRLLYQVSKRLGLTHWYMITEKKLWSLLRKYHILFHQIGQPVDYHGMRIPYLGTIAEMEAHMQRTNPAFLQSFLVGAACPPGANT